MKGNPFEICVIKAHVNQFYVCSVGNTFSRSKAPTCFSINLNIFNIYFCTSGAHTLCIMCQKCLHCIWCNYIHSSCPPGCSCRWMFWKTVLRDGAQTIWTHHAQPNPQFTLRDDKGLGYYRSCLNIQYMLHAERWNLQGCLRVGTWGFRILTTHWVLLRPAAGVAAHGRLGGL